MCLLEKSGCVRANLICIGRSPEPKIRPSNKPTCHQYASSRPFRKPQPRSNPTAKAIGKFARPNQPQIFRPSDFTLENNYLKTSMCRSDWSTLLGVVRKSRHSRASRNSKPSQKDSHWYSSGKTSPSNTIPIRPKKIRCGSQEMAAKEERDHRRDARRQETKTVT